jgi:arginine/lysine/ornithine decarboxylase
VRLEEKIAEFKRTEAALTFSSGYAAAIGTLGALLRKDDVVILDKLAHASLIDGAKLSGAGDPHLPAQSPRQTRVASAVGARQLSGRAGC